MLVYAVRHGESEANLGKFYSGHLDVALTKKGEEDALIAKRLLEGISFDKIYSSDLKRAKNTCQIALPGANPITTELLREISVGNLAGRKFDECRQSIPGFDEMRKAHAFKDFEGETTEEHRERVVKFMRSLEGIDAKRVAVFCHNGTLHRICEWLGDTKSTNGRLFRNCEICVFEYVDGVWSFKGTLYEEDNDANSANEQPNEER